MLKCSTNGQGTIYLVLRPCTSHNSSILLGDRLNMPNIRISFAGGKPPSLTRNAITIGNFDGCHLGHQKLIRSTIEAAQRFGAVPSSLTFFPRPELFFNPELAKEGSLFSESMKSRAFLETGLSAHYIQDFSEAISQMPPDIFFKSVLVDELRANAVIVGENFRFGHGRSGDTGYLKKCGAQYDINTVIENFAELDAHTVSSTRIRKVLKQGLVAEAASLLGRPYLLEGTLIKGDQLGRTIGFPTLNLHTDTQLIPGPGVYCGYVWVQGLVAGDLPKVTQLPAGILPAVFNIGNRPTVNGSTLRVEAHVLCAFSKNDCYDIKAGFYFAQRLRDEMRFEGLDQLKAQIGRDADAARILLSNL